MSNMDVWSSLRWISASTRMFWHHFHPPSDPDFPDPGPIWPVQRYEGANKWPWDNIPMAHTLCICLIWMYEAVWGGYQPHHEVMASFLLHKWPCLPKSGANLAGVTVLGCNHMALRQHTNGSITLNMSKMDVWSGLRWISASSMTLWHHFHPTRYPEFPNLGQTWLVWRYKGATIFFWESIPMAQTLCICLIWMYEAVWGGY